LDTQIDLFLGTLRGFHDQLALFLPKLLAALLLLLAGWIVGPEQPRRAA
jgi:hypothetical protein